MSTTSTHIEPTGIEALVCADITKRQQFGLIKYGRTLANNPAQRQERLQHAYEEAMDLCLYLKWELEKSKSEPVRTFDPNEPICTGCRWFKSQCKCNPYVIDCIQ